MALQARDEPITLRAVAAEAGVSESYLRKNADLSAQIDRLRGSRPVPRPNPRQPSQRSVDTLRTQLDVVHEQVKKLQAENDQLRQENANLRGALLEARRSSKRGTK
jgi:cell division protein FtsB